MLFYLMFNKLQVIIATNDKFCVRFLRVIFFHKICSMATFISHQNFYNIFVRMSSFVRMLASFINFLMLGYANDSPLMLLSSSLLIFPWLSSYEQFCVYFSIYLDFMISYILGFMKFHSSSLTSYLHYIMECLQHPKTRGKMSKILW